MLSKRVADVVLALVLLVPATPLLLAGGVAVFLTTRQGPLFLQTRVGLAGRPFRLIKLRTMRSADDGDHPASKLRDDPRVTPVGRLLRRTSLDELPQLVNVLAGQMSLVGPRPALPIEVAEYPASWRSALSVKPGLTGLWQVSGRSNAPPQRRAVLDRYYVRHRCAALDCRILLRTAGAVISMRGAW